MFQNLKFTVSFCLLDIWYINFKFMSRCTTAELMFLHAVCVKLVCVNTLDHYYFHHILLKCSHILIVLKVMFEIKLILFIIYCCCIIVDLKNLFLTYIVIKSPAKCSGTC